MITTMSLLTEMRSWAADQPRHRNPGETWWAANQSPDGIIHTIPYRNPGRWRTRKEEAVTTSGYSVHSQSSSVVSEMPSAAREIKPPLQWPGRAEGDRLGHGQLREGGWTAVLRLGTTKGRSTRR